MSSKKKELTLQETFYNLCKDLIRYIDKKIVKKYISPNQAQIPKEKRILEKKYNDNKWRYFFEDEETTKEERIKDIFKDNNFLFNLQNLYKELNVVVSKMEENKNNKENLEKALQIKDEKLNLYNEMNNQLLKYFVEKNKNLNLINQNDIINALEDFKKDKTTNDLNPDIIQFYINKINNNTCDKKKDNEKKEYKKEIKNNENINNEKIIKEINHNDNDIKVNKDKKNILSENKVISTLIQAFDIVNKNKKKKIKEVKKNKLIKNIFDSDSNESSSNENEEDLEEDEENEEESEEQNYKKNINKNKNKDNENDKGNIFLNKKIKRDKN